MAKAGNPFVRALVLVLTTTVPFVLACHNAPDYSGPHILGDITPDSQIKDGSPFQIACSLYSTRAFLKGKQEVFNSSNIYIEFDGKPVDDHLIKRPNETSAVIDFSSVSTRDSGFYYCYLNTPDGILSFVCSMHLEVGLAPRTIGEENFGCVSHFYENFTCFWNPPDYHTKTDYSLSSYLFSDGDVSRVAPCPIRYTQTSCGWTLDSDPPYRQFVLTHTLFLTSSNKWGNMTEVFQVNNTEVVTAPEVPNFHVDTVTSTSVSLKWMVPSQLDFGTPDPRHLKFEHRLSEHPSLIYELHIIKTPLEESETTAPDSIEFAASQSASMAHQRWLIVRTNGTSLNVTDLLPFENYKFNVRCIVSAVLARKKDHTPFWSRFIEVNATTLADVPPGPPKFHVGYESRRADSHRRRIILFWQPLEWPYGPNFNYIITYVPILTAFSQHRQHESNNSLLITHPSPGGSVSASNDHMEPLVLGLHSQKAQENTSLTQVDSNSTVEVKIHQLNSSYYTTDLILRSQAYLFKIYAANDVNRSLEYSQIVVERETLLPPRPVSVEAFFYGHEDYEVRWSHPIGFENSLHVVSYVIFFCGSSKPVLEKCTEPLKLIQVPANVTARTLKASQYGNHHFAVTAKYSNGQYSPLSWASCIVPIGLKKLEKVPKVYAKSINSTAIKVTWKVQCTPQLSVITKFELAYCKSSASLTCIGSKVINSIENSTVREFIVTNLEPTTFYRFQLTAWTGNAAGDESDLFFEYTSSPPTSVWFTISILLVTMLCLVLMTCSLKCLYTRYKFLFLVWKTQIELPAEIQSRSNNCDLNSSNASPDSKYAKKNPRNCVESSDYLSTRTLSTTVGDGMSGDTTFNTSSINGNFYATNSITSGSPSETFGMKGPSLPVNRIEKKTIATIGGNVSGRVNESRIISFINGNGTLNSSTESNNDIFSSSPSTSQAHLLQANTNSTGLRGESSIYSVIHPKEDKSVTHTEHIPLVVRRSNETQVNVEDNNSQVFFQTQVPSSVYSLSTNPHPHPSHHRKLVKQDSFESGYEGTPCLSKESSLESGKNNSNVATTSLTKKGYVPFIPHYLDSSAS